MPRTPGVLLSPAMSRRGLRDRLLFHWAARDLSLTARTGQVGSFSRASASGLIVDRFGNLFSPVHSQPRFAACDWEGTGTPDDVELLMEASSTNLCKSSEDVSNATYWNLGGTPIRVGGVVVHGALPMDTITDDDGAFNERYEQQFSAGVFSGTNPIYVSVHVQKHGSESATGPGIDFFDSTASAQRLQMSWTFNAAGVPVVTQTVGTLVASIPLGGGLYRLVFRATGVVNANNHLLIVRPCKVDAEQGTTYMNGYQVEQGTGPSTYKKTTTATVTASGEALTFPFNLPPQTPVSALTLYARYIDRFTCESNVQGAVSARIFEIGGATVRSMLFVTGGKPSLRHDFDGSNTRSSAPAIATQVHGDRIEIRGTVRADGSVLAESRLNGGAIVAGAASSTFAGPYPTAFTSALLAFGGEAGTANNRVGLVEVKVALGEIALDLMGEAG